jgi:hypothetical protein
VGVDVERVNLARVFAHLNAIDRRTQGGCAGTHKVILEDLAAGAGGEDGLLALGLSPLDGLDGELVGDRSGVVVSQGGLSVEECAQVDALLDREAVKVDRLQHMATSKHG